ncbi:hypothetical protein J7U46_16265 [Pelomonas sp. V22]|uniref:hypothetical protein n=1 Tax=Pelomonas sp. V22 TaxID=2822139 RepID=UPI0024A7BB22|nr:hypothetical protein [Pelomonas sp. V22]MDI4634615.1 hypothetical protein [Pelomonas sp. V22]
MRLLILLAGLGLLLNARAEPPADATDLPRIEVQGKGGRPAFPYLALQAGRDQFESRRQRLAPDAQLQFELRERGSGQARPNRAVILSSARAELPMALDQAGRFELPQLPRDESSDAELWFDRDPAVRGWFVPRVRSPGLSEQQTRLGDEQLACEVHSAIVKYFLSWWQRAVVATALGGLDGCVVAAPPGAKAAWLVDGERREQVQLVGKNRRSFAMPASRDWPSGTRVEWVVEFAPPAAAAASR